MLPITTVVLFAGFLLLCAGFVWLARTLRETARTLERNTRAMERVLESLSGFARILEGWTRAVNKEFPVLSDTVRGVAPRMDTFELRLTALEKRLAQVEGETGDLVQQARELWKVK